MIQRPNLYEVFSAYINLPIRVDNVLAQVREYVAVDEVAFLGVDIDSRKMLGMHRLYRRNGAVVCEVYYSNDLNADPPLKRLVCTKELLHLLDGEPHTARTYNAVSKLIDQVVIPHSAAFSNSTLNDRAGVLYALAVLAPRDALHVIRDRVQNGTMSVSDFATFAEIPEQFARLALSDIWTEVLESIC